MDPIVLTEYTDPYSVWCWGAEPILRKLEYVYGPSIEVRVRMGGLFEDFSPMRENFNRMTAGHWEVAAHAFLTGVAGHHRMPTDVDAMMSALQDFNSTWPGCIAVKAASLQGEAAGKTYLRRLRLAVQVEGRAIHHRDVQEAVARESGLDVGKFREALESDEAVDTFRRDLAECRSENISGFPTFVFRGGAIAVRVDGFHPWEHFASVLTRLAPEARPREIAATEASAKEYLGRFGQSATREIAEALGQTDDEAEILLEELEAHGELIRFPGGTGLLWELK